MPPPPIKWAAQLSAVREVTLHGHADLSYWTHHLAPEHLTPTSDNNRAHLLLITAAARFHGVPFRELSLSVAVTPAPDAEFPDAAYLLRAYNSNRFFAWCERTFFHTPYFHADVQVSTSPAAIALLHHGHPLLRAEMHRANPLPPPPTPHPPLSDSGFNGVVHLPRRSPCSPWRNSREPMRRGIGPGPRRRDEAVLTEIRASPDNEGPGPRTQAAAARVPPRAANSPHRQFIARLVGDTETHPFLPTDTFSLNPSRDDNANVLQSLLDSHFTPTHWEIRPNATHAKSKTYPRPAASK